MAKNNGLFPTSGKLGAVIFRKGKNGVNIMSMANSKSKEWYKSSDDAARIRENNSEFKATQLATSALRLGYAGILRSMKDGSSYTRMTSLMREMVKQGTGLRGRQSLEFSTFGQSLKGFQWVSTDLLEEVFNAPFTVTITPGRDGATLTIPDFSTHDYIGKPQGATHFRFVLSIASLSDYAFAPGVGKYLPVDASVNSLGDVVRSADLPLGGMVGSATTLTAALPAGTSMVATSVLVVSVGIEFLQDRMGQLFLFASKNSMKIVEVA